MRHQRYVTRSIYPRAARRTSVTVALGLVLALGACRPTSQDAGTSASGRDPSAGISLGAASTADGGAAADVGPSTVAAPPPIVWSDAPVILGAWRNYETGEQSAPSMKTSAPVTFTIPPDIYVRTGNAGNGQVQFEYLSPEGVVTCTYQGGSSTAHPTTDLDQMHGRRYRLVGCDNGAEAGQSATSTWFSLQVLGGDAQDPSGMTSVALHLGGGCSDQLAAPIAPDEVANMRDGFTWDTVAKLNETDVDGHPAMFHGLIYIESKDQLAALDRLRVYWSAQPISERYRTGFSGRCGRVEHATDGKGVVVYAVFPAHFYNLMRDFGIQAIHGNVAPPFKFIIPSPPDQPEYVNSDGSIRYSALASSGFALWLAAHPGGQPSWYNPTSWPGAISDAAEDTYDWVKGNVVDPAVKYGEYGFDYVGKGWDAALDWSINALDDGWEGVQQGLHAFVGIFSDEIKMHVKVTMLNRDPQFPAGSPFVRLWGPPDALGNRPSVVPAGAHIRVRQWGWGFLPVMTQDELSETGEANLSPIKGASGRGGDVCIEMDTDYATVTTDFIPNEVCDFATGRYGNFEHDIDDTALSISQPDLFGLTQIKDSSDYYRTVIGASPHTFDVLTGWLANNLTTAFAKAPRAMTLCLDFPGTGASALTTALTVAAPAVGGAVAVGFDNKALGALAAALGPVAGPLIEKDLWWPDSDAATSARDSRGVMTHEYGHFAMCGLLYDQAGGPALTGLMTRLAEGLDDSRSDVVAQMTEGWADTFAMQVVGGTNYIQSANSSGGMMHFCQQSPCMDQNYVGANDYSSNPFLDELARFESLFQDAFDRSDSLRRFTNSPGNGDVLVAGSNGLEVSPNPYIANQDEGVSLPGSAWRTWVKHWLERGTKPSTSNVVGGLVQTMADQGFNWCDRCEVLALHAKETDPSAYASDPTGQAGPTFSQRRLRWNACAASPELKDWLGPAPAKYLNMTPACTPCPLHNVIDDSGVCHPCGVNEVARGGQCVSCGSLNGASSNSEECIIG